MYNRCRFRIAKLSDCEFFRVQFKDCDLIGADFYESRIEGPFYLAAPLLSVHDGRRAAFRCTTKRRVVFHKSLVLDHSLGPN